MNVVSVNVVSVNVVSVNVVSVVLFYIYPKFSVDGACKGHMACDLSCCMFLLLALLPCVSYTNAFCVGVSSAIAAAAAS